MRIDDDEANRAIHLFKNSRFAGSEEVVLEQLNAVERVQQVEERVWRIYAPAKINLALRVFPVRADGFHALETWMVPLSWHDTVEYAIDEPLGLEISGRSEGIPTDMGKNLIGRALGALAQRAGVEARGRLKLHKILPPGGGLGGGSSDAANVLVMLAKVWELNWAVERLEEAAAELGSDVPFFVRGKSALCKGRGELMTALRPMHPLFAVLILPAKGLATKPVFEAFDQIHPVERPEIKWCQWAGMTAQELNTLLINDLEPAAFSLAPWLSELRNRAMAAIAQPVHMTGSGSTLFTLCPSGAQASATAEQLTVGLPGDCTCVPVRILR